MDRYCKVNFFMALGMIAMPMVVSAVCLSPGDATYYPDGGGYAVTVQSDQGQGSIDCTAFIGEGGPMRQLENVQQSSFIGTVDNPIEFTIVDTDPNDGILEHADVVFIGNSDGSRCTQYYKGTTTKGYAAAGTKTNKESTLVACTDDSIDPQPQDAPTPPVSTASDCDVDTQSERLQDAINDNGKYDVVIGIGRGDKGDNTAICSDRGAMKTCVDMCITPDPSDPSTPTWYPPSDDVNSPYQQICKDETRTTFPLACRACELNTVVDSNPFLDGPAGTAGNPAYCWQQLQKVNLDEGTFKKAPGPKSNQVWIVKEYAGSTCYQISGTTDSGYKYSYWVPSTCP